MKEVPTPYPDVNAVLSELSALVQDILGSHLVGMYVYGSLALGDFDPTGSDIDYLVVTDSDLSESSVTALDRMHSGLNATGSRWSSRIEAAYIPRNALHASAPTTTHYPQIEKGRRLVMEPLESGWVLQLYTLREHGIVITGPNPRSLISPIDPDDIRKASAAHAMVWAEQARSDPDWLDWVRQRENHAFVVMTLCRMLYSLTSGKVASKRGAAQWMVRTTGRQWAALVQAALAGQHEPGIASDTHIHETIDLIDYTVQQYRSSSFPSTRHR